ncbi:hypothetical protein [Inhella proteolytica]|uniref:DUF1330 domain-containing protein n=1 Tax=Inhella proteolytica TaxID=2795029 RepID=A0A931J2E5_9BURK|nr:hypothetical protein [Inhella proteolytica]MBH9576910.1 hypothetical protein [Inhella proteolytica]
MKFGRTLALSALLALAASLPAAAQTKPYNEGSVWGISLIKVKPGMQDIYLRDLGVARKKLMEEAKKQGLILSEKILIGQASDREDWDLMLMVEFKNWAAFDGLTDKFDALSLKMVGTEEKQVQMMVKRTETREILGNKTMQEITLK